jgi:glycosyltransferase involved in cell wall biosynthesis
MNKIKVVWICHFSNADVRKHLPLTKKGCEIYDFASWVTNLIQEFKKFENIELHIISPHAYLKAIYFSYFSEGVNYHFYNRNILCLNKYLSYIVYRSNELTGFMLNRLLVSRLINKIKPDIINLFGAENAYYSATVLGVKQIPVLISIQGIYSNNERFKYFKKDKIRYSIERKIHSENKYFSINASFMQELIKRDSKDPILFWNRYPLKIIKLKDIAHIEKKYDFVLFSRLTVMKGTEDALKAIALVKKFKPNVSLRMMGSSSKKNIEQLKTMSNELGIGDNVFISEGYVAHEDLLCEAAKAKFYLLPTKLDTIPSTIFEAIYLGLPVVSYNTGDIPLLNKGDIRVLLSDRDDIESLGKNMIRLLAEPNLAGVISGKAKDFVEKWFDNRTLALNFVSQYKAVLAHYYYNEPIPDSLLYRNYLKNI